MYLFNKRSLQNLKGVHPTLVKLMKTAILSSPFPFVITEGCRSLERQKQLLKEKKTRTLQSYHLTGHAVDIAIKVGEKITWEYRYYEAVAKHIQKIAHRQHILITWGGTWKNLVDACHFQLEEERKKILRAKL